MAYNNYETFRKLFFLFVCICPPPGLLPVMGPCEQYMTPTLDTALLCSSRAGIKHHLSLSLYRIRSTASIWQFLWSRRSTNQATTAGLKLVLLCVKIWFRTKCKKIFRNFSRLSLCAIQLKFFFFNPIIF